MSAADRSLAAFLENEPTYFSMYDKVKARSLKLQQQKRQEEERKTIQQQQQDKFNALRQARIASTSKRENGNISVDKEYYCSLHFFFYFFLSFIPIFMIFSNQFDVCYVFFLLINEIFIVTGT